MKKLITLVLVLLLVGCGGSKVEYVEVETIVVQEVEVPVEVGVEVIKEVPVEVVTGGVDVATIPALASRKIIYNATLRVDSFDLDEYHQLVNNQVIIHGGYYQREDARSKDLALTIRIPSAALDDFLDALKAGGEVTYFTKSSQDVTNTYTTYESRKLALEAQHQRYIELIMIAETIEDIIELEEARADIESELTEIGIRLTSYDNLVEYSTVVVEVDLIDTETYYELPVADVPETNKIDSGKDFITLELSNREDETISILVNVYDKDILVHSSLTEVFSLFEEELIIKGLQSDTVYKFEYTTIQDGHDDSRMITNTYSTEASYGDKVVNTFTNTVNGFGSFLEEASLFILGALPYLLIGGVLFFPGRMIYKYIKKENEIRDKNNSE